MKATTIHGDFCKIVCVWGGGGVDSLTCTRERRKEKKDKGDLVGARRRERLVGNKWWGQKERKTKGDGEKGVDERVLWGRK